MPNDEKEILVDSMEDKDYNVSPERSGSGKRFYWMPLLGVLFPGLLFLCAAWPCFGDAVKLYADEAGALANGLNFFALLQTNAVGNALMIADIVLLILLVARFVLAAVMPVMREYRRFNIVFLVLLSAQTAIHMTAIFLSLNHVGEIDALYRAAHPDAGTLGGYSLFSFASLWLWIDLLFPPGVIVWWSMVLVANVLRRKEEKGSPKGTA